MTGGHRASEGDTTVPGTEGTTRPSPDSGRSTHPDADEVPRPEWIPTDDVIGPCPDRQVLVVGTTPTGLVLTLLLRAAGYDPVVVSGADRPATSRITFLSPAAVEVLCVLDVGERVLDAGRPVGGVTVRWLGDGGGHREVRVGAEGDRAPSIVVPTPVLRRTLWAAVPAGATTRERAVDSALQRDGGVDVTFDDNVREWFDVVVDAGGGGDSLRLPNGGRTACPLRQYEASVGGDPGRTHIRDVWRPTGVMQRLPTPADSPYIVRVTTPASQRSANGFGTGDGPDLIDAADVPDAGEFDRRRVRQVLLPDGKPTVQWWGSGRIARCGPAACPAAPAAGVDVSLGVTDALGLVSALAREGTTVSEAVDAYAADRCRRFAAVRRAATAADRAVSTPEKPDDPLGSLRVLRAVALEPFFGTAPPTLGAPNSG